uniref:Germin-like protein n=1 Tax=Populus alba TaxID=43335 RepID=A0A4U5PNR1_POPAL|nr:hypothetical protein D5086_0000203350 [Populus alba]
MEGLKFLVVSVVLALASSFASASDPSPLQDFCVAMNETMVDPQQVTEKDFFFSGLNVPRDTSSPVGSNVTAVNVAQIPGLNTLGISLARIDFAPYGGLNPPHTHPRATEILVVVEVGLIHFQLNVGKTNAVALASLSSQNPGVITIANAVFGADPPINPNVLTKAFQVDKKVVDYLQKQFWTDNNN